MNAARLLAPAVVLVALFSPAPAAETVVLGEHYRLTSSGKKAEADDWLKTLEAAWPQYLDFFGKAPPLKEGEHLEVRFVETLAEMQDAIRKAGGTPPGIAGGYYDPVSKTAYAWRQPTIWWTRGLLIHECAHQFHQLGRATAKTGMPLWYVEGTADHLAHHTWDGEHLRIGVVPMLSLEDWPTAALKSLTSGAFKLEDVVENRAGLDRPTGMHLVRYLCQAEGGKLRPKFDEIAVNMDRSQKVSASNFARLFGPTNRFVPAMRDWLSGVQQPWEYLFVEWDARGADAVRGSAESRIALCRRKAETRQVSARIRRVGGGAWKGGLLLRYEGPKDYVLGLVDNGKRCYIDRLKAGTWTRLVDVEAPPADNETWRLEGTRSSGSVGFTVNGETIGDLETGPGSMGLAIDSCALDFTEIAAH